MLGFLGRHASSNIVTHSYTRCIQRIPLSIIRWQSTTATHDGPAISETNRAEATMKRFWKDVGVQTRGDGIAVTLDDRPLKMPSGKPMLLPRNKTLLASLIAIEWDSQEILLKPHALPMTSLAARAADALTDKMTRAEVRESLLKYLDTDTICFYQDYPPQLEKLQTEHWDPLLEWVRETYGANIKKSESILSFTQPEEAKTRLREVLMTFDEWEMAAMERATYMTKSFIIALALVKGRLNVEQASLAAQVEVNSQIERWGEVEDTHDVDYHDVRRQLGSAACVLSKV